MSESRPGYRANTDAGWDAAALLTLRRQLGLTQQQLAHELGVRQQTVSEWETGAYRPRGASARLLSIVAEGAGFAYRAGPALEDAGGSEDAGTTPKRSAARSSATLVGDTLDRARVANGSPMAEASPDGASVGDGNPISEAPE